MDAERLQQIQELFHAALERPAEERDGFLNAACAADPDLRAAVKRYLRADADDFSLLDAPVAHVKDLDMPGEPSSLPHEYTIRGYHVERLLGQGGMGMVYLAYDRKLDRPVALKLLPLHLSTDEEAKARFIHEARATAALDHPHIATIYEVGETEAGRLFIAMAYYEGETLKQKIAQGPVPVAETLQIATQVARGLAAAHRREVVHRDIKPANLIITPEGQVKIMDFGIAKVAGHDLTKVGQMVGTIAYMSPEQARGEAVDHRTDIWSLGVVLYEMLTGERPFRGEYPQAVLYAILNEAPAPLTQQNEEVPEALQHVVDRLLAKDREARYEQAADLLADLERLASNDAVQRGELRRTDVPERLPDNLPVPLTSFVGRERELEQARALLAHARLLTLTGTGGTGKTRLALHLAAAVKETFRDGVCFVALASLNDAALVASTIAQALGVRETGGVPISEQLIAFLRYKEGLLVLDNFEQVVEAGPLVTQLLAACRDLKILVTSRVPLHVQGEHELPVPSLELPATGSSASPEQLVESEAVALFVQRARAVKPGFTLEAVNASAVVEICTRLDGLPLAIELAAARIKVLSPRAILTRLQHRFDLLTGGARDLPTRHRTLREAIAWSYDLLAKDEKKLFRRLAVFVGGHSLEAAEQVCRAVADLSVEVLDRLASLVDKNLVRQEEQPDGEPRFSMLETIREFDLECLIASGDEAMARRAHRDFFLALAEEAEPQLTGPQQVAWLARLEKEHDNLCAALDWTLDTEGNVEAAAQLGAALWRFWLIRGHLSEGSERLERVLTQAGASISAATRAKLLTGAGTLAHNQGRYRTARMLYDESLMLYRELGDARGTARTLGHLGWIGWRLGEYDAARTISEESLTLHGEQQDRRGVALALNNLGWVAQHQGEYVKARSYFGEVLALQRAMNDRRGVAFALSNLGWTLASQGDYARATALLEDALAAFREVGDRQLTTFTLGRLGAVVHDRGDTERAAALLEQESLPLFRMIGDSWGIAFACSGLGRVMKDRGNYERAGTLYEESLTLRRQIEDTFGIAESLGRLAELRRLQQEPEQAAARYKESLRLRRDLGDKGGLVECLEGLAYLAWNEDQLLRATRLFGAAEALRAAIGGARPPRSQAAYDDVIAFLRVDLGEEDFSRAWDDGHAMTLDQAVAYACEGG